MSSDTESGLMTLKEWFDQVRGWVYLEHEEIIKNLDTIYTNLVYGDQTEEECAIEVGKILNRLKEHWSE